MLLHRKNKALGRQLQEIIAESTCVDGRPLDQSSDLVEQLIVDNWLGALARDLQDRSDDFLSAFPKINFDFALFTQCTFVVVGVPEGKWLRAKKTVTDRAIGTCYTKHGAGDELRSMHHHKSVHGPHELCTTAAPTHRLGNRQRLQRGLNHTREDGIQCGTARFDA